MGTVPIRFSRVSLGYGMVPMVPGFEPLAPAPQYEPAVHICRGARLKVVPALVLLVLMKVEGRRMNQ